MSEKPDEYSAILTTMQRAYSLAIGDATLDEHERHAVEVACIMDRAIENAEQDFAKLESDFRGLKRQ